jgi:hypothetical protein
MIWLNQYNLCRIKVNTDSRNVESKFLFMLLCFLEAAFNCLFRGSIDNHFPVDAVQNF